MPNKGTETNLTHGHREFYTFSVPFRSVVAAISIGEIKLNSLSDTIDLFVS